MSPDVKKAIDVSRTARSMVEPIIDTLAPRFEKLTVEQKAILAHAIVTYAVRVGNLPSFGGATDGLVLALDGCLLEFEK